MTTGELIARCVAEKRDVSARRGGQIPYFDESRHNLGPVVMIDGDDNRRASVLLGDLQKWLQMHIGGDGPRVNCNGQSVGFWLDSGDFAPFILPLWSLIITWCTDRGYTARLRWRDEMMQPCEVNAAEVEADDILPVMHLTHTIRIQIPPVEA